MAYKVAKWLIIPFFVIFVMSHNTFALPFDITDYNFETLFISPNVNCNYSNNTSSSNVSYCSSGPNYNITGITTVNTYSYDAGDIISLYITVWNYADGYDVSPIVPYLVNNNDFALIEITQDVDGTYFDLGTGTITYNVGSNYDDISFNSSYYNVRYYKVVLKARRKNTASLGLSTNQSIGVIGGPNVRARLYWGVKYTLAETAEDEAAQKELNSTENIENQTPSDTPGGDNQQATNLIGNISGIFNQIRDIPVASSCSINANFGNLDLGNLNLCTGKENMPFIVNFGATVFQLVFVVSTGLILVRQVLNLYDWSRK